MSLQTKKFYEFEGFRLDLTEKTLLHDGKPVPLTPKVFDTLNLLVENAGHLLEKDELMKRVWQDRFVEESNLTFNVKVLRKALGDDAAHPRFIETVPRRGYRFIANVESLPKVAESTAVAEAEASVSPAVHNPQYLRPMRVYLAFASLGVILVSVLAIGSWFVGSGASGNIAPILAAPFGSEKLSTNGEVVHAAISPDGRNVIYTNGIYGKQSVWLRQLDSGNNVELIPPSDGVYAGLAFAPDGNSFYFVRRPSGTGAKSAVYRLSLFGGVPIRIVDDTHGRISVSPDGGRISYVRCLGLAEENCSLWVAHARDGSNETKVASRRSPAFIGDNEFAPDGRSIAFAAGQTANAGTDFGLAEVDLLTGKERSLTSEKFFNIKNIAWFPSKNGLLVTASRIPNKHFRVWQVSNTGDVRPLTNDAETYSGLSLDREANLLVATQVRQDFRLRLFQISGTPTKELSAGARNVSFITNERILFSTSLSGNEEIWISDLDDNGKRQLTNDSADDVAPVVSMKGGLIFFASNRSGSVHIWRMNPDGSDQTQLTKEVGGFPLGVSADGGWIYFHHGLHRTLWRVSAEGDKEELVLNESRSNFALSPDGSSVAYPEKEQGQKTVTIVSLPEGRLIRRIAIADEAAQVVDLDWMPDGRGLAYVLADENARKNILWLDLVDKGQPRQIAILGDEEIAHLRISPDGKSFAVTQGGWRHDAVLISGLK